YDERTDGGSSAIRIADSFFMRANEARSFLGATTGHFVTLTSAGIMRSPTPVLDTLPPLGADVEIGSILTTAQEFVDPLAYNYALKPSSFFVSGGSSPTGSAVGSRAFRFPWGRFTSYWGASAAFAPGQPADFSNGACPGLAACNQDTDGDGVLDLH